MKHLTPKAFRVNSSLNELKEEEEWEEIKWSVKQLTLHGFK